MPERLTRPELLLVTGLLCLCGWSLNSGVLSIMIAALCLGVGQRLGRLPLILWAFAWASLGSGHSSNFGLCLAATTSVASAALMWLIAGQSRRADLLSLTGN